MDRYYNPPQFSKFSRASGRRRNRHPKNRTFTPVAQLLIEHARKVPKLIRATEIAADELMSLPPPGADTASAEIHAGFGHTEN
jgi:hypothetical protein